MSLSPAQSARNRAKYAENRQRERDGLPPLDRKHGQPAKLHPRVNVVRRVVNGVEQFDANVRTAGSKRTFCGRYATRAAGEAACSHYLATGERPVRARQPRKTHERRVAAPKTQKATPAVRNARDGAARWAALYRARREAIEAFAA